VALSGKMQNCFRRYFVKQVFNALLIADIRLREAIARIAAHGAERLEIPGISQFVNIDHEGVCFSNQVPAYR
jgi:hypothetical protein